MTDSTDQVAPREKPGFWVPGRLALRGMQMGTATILLTLIGPFGTFTDLTLPWRGLYWAVAMLCGFIDPGAHDLQGASPRIPAKLALAVGPDHQHPGGGGPADGGDPAA